MIYLSKMFREMTGNLDDGLRMTITFIGQVILYSYLINYLLNKNFKIIIKFRISILVFIV